MADISEYISQAEYAEKVGLSQQRIGQLCVGKRIPTVKIGRALLIHKDATITPVREMRDYPVKRVNIWLEKSTWDEVNRISRETKTSKARIIDMALRKYLEMDE